MVKGDARSGEDDDRNEVANCRAVRETRESRLFPAFVVVGRFEARRGRRPSIISNGLGNNQECLKQCPRRLVAQDDTTLMV